MRGKVLCVNMSVQDLKYSFFWPCNLQAALLKNLDPAPGNSKITKSGIGNMIMANWPRQKRDSVSQTPLHQTWWGPKFFKFSRTLAAHRKWRAHLQLQVTACGGLLLLQGPASDWEYSQVPLAQLSLATWSHCWQISLPVWVWVQISKYQVHLQWPTG